MFTAKIIIYFESLYTHIYIEDFCFKKAKKKKDLSFDIYVYMYLL